MEATRELKTAPPTSAGAVDSFEARALDVMMPEVPAHAPDLSAAAPVSVAPIETVAESAVLHAPEPAVVMAEEVQPELQIRQPPMSLEELQATLATSERDRGARDYSLLYEPPPAEPPPMYPSLQPTVTAPPAAPAATSQSAVPPSYEEFISHKFSAPAEVVAPEYESVAPSMEEEQSELLSGDMHVSTRELEELAAQANMKMRIIPTPKHASANSLKHVQCISCEQWMQVLAEAKMVYCSTCSSVSPCDSEGNSSQLAAEPARTLPRRGILNCIGKVFS